MNNKQENQKYSRSSCEEKVIEKEVYCDISPVDAFIETSFSIKFCDNESCGVEKGSWKDKI